MQNSCTSILELGVFLGGSMRLWAGYFPHALVYGIDVNIYQNLCRELCPRIRLIQADAYTSECASTFADQSIDIIIDDGPHTLESLCKVMDLYSRTIKPGGYLILEDIQSMDWISILQQHVPDGIQSWVEDLRHIKNRYDDVLFIMKFPE
jgi:cephalosporin hydroxylase